MYLVNTKNNLLVRAKVEVLNLLLFFLSLAIFVFARPYLSTFFCHCASFFGMGLFFYSIRHVELKKYRFLIGVAWFFCVQAALLNWLATPDYQGFYVYGLHSILCLLLAVQFGLLILFLPRQSVSWKQVFFLSSLWTLFEWSRLFFLCGFIWNPVGLTLTASVYTAQLAAFFGVYGLSWCVMFFNLVFYKSLMQKKLKNIGVWLLFCCIPIFVSFCYISVQKQVLAKQKGSSLKIALVQTAIYPAEKNLFMERKDQFVNPYVQWQRIGQTLQNKQQKSFDLIVLPEAAVSFSAKACVYTYDEAKKIVAGWASNPLDSRELLTYPYAQKEMQEGQIFWRVNNLFFAKMLALCFDSEVIIGLEESVWGGGGDSYASAFFIQKDKAVPMRYDKRVLLPVAEYLPGEILRSLALRYGMTGFFTHGNEAGVFEGKGRYFPTICYEECFGDKVRQGKKEGGNLLVNLSNDAWYPHSRLNYTHFDHGRVRSIENGVYQVRACNTGVTAALDPFGRVVGELKGVGGSCDNLRDALVVHIPSKHVNTLYARFGDAWIVAICLSILVFFLLNGLFKRKKT
ncbi:apolipoprotein N-acyltransferase [Candidatus Aerophobetes bacterium]|uniref:Apolipoprotein N-acyltransferase n=1 Tax=Aerophobetes bacterium TaxID=2030807 RepID=A0A2A4X791_UNCAE|nr:MAG: apolipoprotein N-acyltransferase [Candidatus Aerophobetes bacterium]